jgi:hypothetical protein
MNKAKELVLSKEALAFRNLIVVPLGADNNEEYMEMKEVVCRSLEFIAKAGGMEEHLHAAYQSIFKDLQDPLFEEFLKKFTSNKQDA